MGSAAGWMATDQVLRAAEKTAEFDTSFSNAAIAQADTEEVDIPEAGQKSGSGTAAAAGIGYYSRCLAPCCKASGQ